MTDFKKIIEEEYGITDIDSYVNYKKQKAESGLSVEEIQKLSPDTIRSDEFWEWTAKSAFEKDAVTFGMTKDTPPETCNLVGFLISLETGCINYFMHRRAVLPHLNVLEIGPGYGFFKNICEESPTVSYKGVDVYPRIPGIYKIADGDTLLPDEVRNEKYDIVFSSNVFQHLTPRQRDSYYQQVSQLLKPHGIFSFNSIASRPNFNKGFVCGDKKYLCHYGQYTEIESLKSYWTQLNEYFEIIASGERADDLVTFHCRVKSKNITEEK